MRRATALVLMAAATAVASGCGSEARERREAREGERVTVGQRFSSELGHPAHDLLGPDDCRPPECVPLPRAVQERGIRRDYEQVRELRDGRKVALRFERSGETFSIVVQVYDPERKQWTASRTLARSTQPPCARLDLETDQEVVAGKFDFGSNCGTGNTPALSAAFVSSGDLRDWEVMSLRATSKSPEVDVQGPAFSRHEVTWKGSKTIEWTLEDGFRVGPPSPPASPPAGDEGYP